MFTSRLTMLHLLCESTKQKYFHTNHNYNIQYSLFNQQDHFHCQQAGKKH